MENLPTNHFSLNNTYPVQATSPLAGVSPYHLETARNLAKSKAHIAKNELLAMDMLQKVEQLSLLEKQILERCPSTAERTRFIIGAFTYDAFKNSGDKQ